MSRYFTRMTGMELTDHTRRYIIEVFAKAIDGLLFKRNYIRLIYLYMFRYED
jgi:hypothetical protein